MNAIARPFLTAVLLAACVASAAAAERHERRDVSGYASVVLAAPLDLRIVQGEREGLELDGDEAALAEIEAVVEEGMLKIRLHRRAFMNWNYKVRGVLQARRLDRLAIAGSGDIVSDALKGGEMTISVAGSGDVRIAALTATRLEVKIAGSGDVSLAGRVDSLSTSITGAGEVKAAKLEARAVKIAVTGAGDATVWARETLEVKVAGAGDVKYYGDAKVEKRVIGAGSVTRLGAAPA
jgi:hypothetical protein